MIQGGPLRAIDYTLPMASAQVKSAVLLAGLYARGETSVTEPGQSRDHTERMLRYFLVDVQEKDAVEEGEPKRLAIKGGQMPESRNFTVPGDISSAAFWLAAAFLFCLPVRSWAMAALAGRPAMRHVLAVPASLAFLAVSVTLLVGSSYNPFIYFRF